MLRIIAVFFSLFFLVLTGLVIAALLIPKEVYKAQIEQQASERLLREVKINGPVQIGIFPKISVSASNVQIANLSGFSSENLAVMEKMHANVQLLPLFSKQVEISEFTLIRPEITLEKLKTGAVNWTINSNTNKDNKQTKEQAFVRSPDNSAIKGSLGDISLVAGQIIYIDHSKNTKTSLSDINLQLTMPDMEKEMALNGDFPLNGHAYSIATNLGSAQDFLEGKTSPFAIKLAGELINFDFDGAFLDGPDIGFAGKLDMALPNLSKIAASSDKETAFAPGTFEMLSVSGTVDGSTKHLSFKQAVLNFDQITGTGDFSISMTGKQPKLAGALQIKTLDLNPYLPPVPEPGTPIAPWSTKAMSLDALQLIDADLSLAVASMKMRNIEFADTSLKTVVKHGRLRADFTKTSLYGGQGSGHIALNSNGKTKLQMQGKISGVQALPLFEAAAGFDRISGTGEVQFDITTSGNSIDSMMKSMAGTAALQMKDGSIRGVNLAQVLRSAQSFLLNGALAANDNAPAKTDFSELLASAVIKNGVARNTDMKMLSPLVRVTGQGQIDIGRQSLDYRLNPRAVASLKGQGGSQDMKGINVPFRIQGPWNNIKAGIDTDALQEKALQRAKTEAAKLVKDNVGGELGSVLQNLLGEPDNTETTSPEQKTPKTDEEKALDALGGLFGFGAPSKEDKPKEPQD